MGERWFYYKAIVADNKGYLFHFVFMNNNLQLARDHAEMVSRMQNYTVKSVSRLDNETGKKLINENGIFIAV